MPHTEIVLDTEEYDPSVALHVWATRVKTATTGNEDDDLLADALDDINRDRVMCEFCSCPIESEFANSPCPSR